MPDCKSLIGGETITTQKKTLKKHYSLHFYTVRNKPCDKCELMDQKPCFQILYSTSVHYVIVFLRLINRFYFENCEKNMHNHKCNKPKELPCIRSCETQETDWRPLSFNQRPPINLRSN